MLREIFVERERHIYKARMKTEKQLKINGYPEKNTGTLDFVSTGIQ
jgi:hypothetical protein